MSHAKLKWQVSMEYYPLLGLFWLLGFLPRGLNLAVSQTLLRGLWACLPKRQKIADGNLARSFPKFSASARRQIALDSVANLSRGLSVFARIPRMRSEEWRDLIQLEGLELAQEALSQGRGALAFTAHFGCWEAMAVHVSRLVPSAIVVRPLDNPRLEALVSGVRSIGGIKIIPRRRALSEGLRTLKENRILGILVDQNFAPGSLFVNFMGRPAATTPIVSLLARKTGCPVFPLHNVWENGRIRIIFGPPLTLSRNENRTLAMAEDTQAMNLVLESWIRKDPGQWLWLHNRWKRQPRPGELVYPAAASKSGPVLAA
jgi:KDO2-lipid IV(A) lauroyltransferase